MIAEAMEVLGGCIAPIKNVEMGNTFSVDELTPHSFAIYGIALLGKELAIVELITVVMVVNKMNDFFLYTKH